MSEAHLPASAPSHLIKRDGSVRPVKVEAAGMCCYVESSRTEAARRQNRRAEIRLVHLVAKRDVVSSSNNKGVQ